VYVSNAGSSTISGFALSSTGALSALPGTVVGENTAGATNLDTAVSADGKFLFALNSGDGTIGIFAIQKDGTLKNLGSADGFTPNTGFNGIAANQRSAKSVRDLPRELAGLLRHLPKPEELQVNFRSKLRCSEGTELLTSALSKGSVGLYQLQAAIAAVHDEAARAGDTDWPQILALYELLKRVSPSPMVTLNHAIAATMVHGPSNGLELLRALDSDAWLAGHYRLDAVRAHLLEMTGDQENAIKHYRIAAGRTTIIPEQNYLMTQAARLAERTRNRGLD